MYIYINIDMLYHDDGDDGDDDDDDVSARAALAVRSRPQVRSETATRIGEHTGDRQLMLVAGELADLGGS